MKAIKPITVLSFLLAAPFIRADFIASTYDLNPSLPSASPGANFSTIFDTASGNASNIGYTAGNAASFAGAQQITIGGSAMDTFELSSITLPVALSKALFNPALINVSIVADGGAGDPSGTPVWTGNLGTLSGGTLSTTPSSVSLAIAPGVSVPGGSLYWVVLKQNTNVKSTPSLGGFNGVYWHVADSAVNGEFTKASSTLASTSGGIPNSPWAVNAGTLGDPVTPYALALEGTLTSLTPVPEPGQWAMAGVMILGFAGFGFRQMKAAKKA